MQMKDVVMHMMIVFIVIVAWCIYVLWAQNDDLCFYLIFGLLLAVLYILSRTSPSTHHIEAFYQQGSGSGRGSSANNSSSASAQVDIVAYKKLIDLKNDTANILQPRLENLVAAFRGNAKVEQEQKYDEDGNEIDESKPDEVSVPKSKETEIRALNMVLRDMRKFDPGYYYGLMALALGQNPKQVFEEYPI